VKIVYVSGSVIPSRTANGIQVMRMCEAFAEAGHDVTLIAPHIPARYEQGVDDAYAFYGVAPTFRLRKIWWPRFKGKRYVYALLSGLAAVRLKPDLVYGRNPLSLCWASLLGMRTVYEAHAPFTEQILLDRLAFRWLSRSKRLAHVVAISQALASLIAPCFPGKRMLIAHDGAAVETPAVDRAALAAFGLEGGPGLLIGYVGHLYRGRGIELILKIAARMTGHRFLLIGGTESDLKRWRAEDVPANVHFGGFVPPKQISALCGACDVLLMPYQQRVEVHGGGGNTVAWMSPLKMFEYMAAGRAIVATDLPVLREVLRHGKNAWLLPPDDVDAWCDALNGLAQNDELRASLGRAARDDIEEHYSWARRVERVLEGIGGED